MNETKFPTNEGTIKVVTRTLASIAVICVLMVCILAFTGKQIPPELNTVMGGSIAALTAMLVNTRPTSSTQDVKVTNPPTEPVPTEVQEQNQQL